MTTRDLVGAWYGEAGQMLGRPYHRWFDPVAEALVDEVLARGDVDDAAVRLGAARAHAGFHFDEVLADWSILFQLLPPAVRDELDEAHLTAALGAGFESVGPESFTRAAYFGGAGELRRRLGHLYRQHREAGLQVADTHALILVHVDADDLAPGEHGSALHSVATVLREHFPFVGAIASLGPTRFAVVAHRHPGLAVSIGTLQTALQSAPALLGTTLSLWLAPLPASAAALPRFVRRLVVNPAPAWAVGHVVDEPGGDRLSAHFAETPRATTPVSGASLPRPVHRAVAEAWNGGLSLLTAALAVVLLAAGMVKAVGPDDERSRTETTFELLAPRRAPVEEPPAVVEVPVDAGSTAVTGNTVPPPTTDTTVPAAPPPARFGSAASAGGGAGPALAAGANPAPAPAPVAAPEEDPFPRGAAPPARVENAQGPGQGQGQGPQGDAPQTTQNGGRE